MTLEQHGRPANNTRFWLHDYLLVGVIALATYFISSLLLSAYTSGDRQHYARFYDALSETDLWAVPAIQRGYTGSGEPVYGIIMWTGARLGIPNQLYIAVANAILCGLLATVLRRARAVFWMYPLVFSNYYLLVLLTSAERLKYAAIFILIALLSKGITRAFLLLVAPLIHLQTVILYVAASVGALFDPRTTLEFWGRALSKKKVLFAATGVMTLLCAWQMDYLIEKMRAYAQGSGDVIVLLGITAATFLTFPRRINLVLAVGSLCIAAFILGGERVNMLGYVLYAYYCFAFNRGASPYLAVMSLYVSYKSIGYVQAVFAVGHGFG